MVDERPKDDARARSSALEPVAGTYVPSAAELTSVPRTWAGLKAAAIEGASRICHGLGGSGWGLALPAATFVALLAGVASAPQKFEGPLDIEIHLPSESAIPEDVPTRPVDANDPVYKFRYLETGTEFRAGIPYWIFRIMPRIFPEVFRGQGYEVFGFNSDDQSYFSKRAVPRGMALGDSEFRSEILNLKFKLKRVSINCSGCHRGEYLDAQGRRVLQDGMPNHTANLQAFKRFFASAFQDPRFEPTLVISEINRALTLEEKKPPLTPREELAYRSLVLLLRSYTVDRPSRWMDPPRADNGPGRIDPFNAVKFEVLKVPDDHTVATLDFPSTWNQRAEIRPWHHFDGNTADSFARNFGSVIGVGGVAPSVNKVTVQAVGDWFDILPPPAFPFAAPAPADVEQGAKIYQEKCATCHGTYDRTTNRVTRSAHSRYMEIDETVGTDPERYRAFPDAAARALNSYGFVGGLWPDNAFRAAKAGYLAGPLDGVWARAPYLHNGSVPNLDQLLRPVADRSRKFWRGNRRYDAARVGFVHDEPQEGGRALFEYDTSLTGNSNAGHEHPVDDAQRPLLIAYLKTL